MATGGADPSDVIDFWFADALSSAERAEARVKLWFSKNGDFDRAIAHRFGSLPESAARGELNAWRGEAASALALVIVLDQFPRNLFRQSPRAFDSDPLAREVALAAISREFDLALHPLHASFLYLPLEHAEDIDLQEQSVRLFERLHARAPIELRSMFESFASYARWHRDVIHRFGRFPHRNEVLHRPSTPAETTYLESAAATFW